MAEWNHLVGAVHVITISKNHHPLENFFFWWYWDFEFRVLLVDMLLFEPCLQFFLTLIILEIAFVQANL
jgi:hypothetical protein